MRLLVVRTDHAAKTKSEGASAEDSGSYNFHKNRFPGTTIVSALGWAPATSPFALGKSQPAPANVCLLAGHSLLRLGVRCPDGSGSLTPYSAG